MKFSILPLGGVGEIGMNMYIYETPNSALIVDCGVKFARNDDPSVDLIIPDFSYLETIKDKLCAVIVSHAHEDHIGALPFLLKKYDIPVVTNIYSAQLIKLKLDDQKVSAAINHIEPNSEFETGDFTVELIPISHSIHGTFAILIKTADTFACLHISDYKIDFAPPSSAAFDLKAVVTAAKSGINCLLADSTNCLEKRFTKGEREVFEDLEEIFKTHSGRIFFTTFASNTERLQAVFDIAKKYKRKVAIEGTSILKNMNVARALGLMKIDENIIIPRKSIETLPDNEVCVIASGSQGEFTSVMSKISQNDYGKIIIRAGDLFIFSSRIIPGNEESLIRIINKIALYGGRYITSDDAQIHVSGHASRYDTELLLKIIRPDYLIPIHGEHIHLRGHKDVALGVGMKEESVIMPVCGQKLIFEDGVYLRSEDVSHGKMFVDSKNNEIIISLDELKLRKKLSLEGVVVGFFNVDLVKGQLSDKMLIDCAGFRFEESDIKELKKELLDRGECDIFERFKKDVWAAELEVNIRKFFKRKYSRTPVVRVNINVG